MTDYAQELAKYPEATAEEKAELEKLANLQKDIAVGGSAEDFVRHPFFKSFENQMNAMINDSKGAIMNIESLDDLKAFKARISAITELKQWVNSKVMGGRIAKKAIEVYEEETEDLNAKVQAAIDQSKITE